MLWRQIGDLLLENLEEPKSDVTIEAAEEHGVDKITGFGGVTEIASWIVGVWEDSAQSLLGGEEVVDESPEERIVG